MWCLEFGCGRLPNVSCLHLAAPRMKSSKFKQAKLDEVMSEEEETCNHLNVFIDYEGWIACRRRWFVLHRRFRINDSAFPWRWFTHQILLVLKVIDRSFLFSFTSTSSSSMLCCILFLTTLNFSLINSTCLRSCLRSFLVCCIPFFIDMLCKFFSSSITSSP